MITWGISANSHDAALAVFKDKKLVFASHSERFSGIKNDPDLCDSLVSHAKRYGEPDEIVWYESPMKKTLRQLKAGQGFRYSENNVRKYLEKFKVSARKISNIDHHRSHAAAGYFTSTYSDATVVCIDAIGEFETFTIWKAEGNKLKKVHSQGYPHSIGLWYSAMTQRIGLKPNEDEYILMGMAAYGDARRYNERLQETFFAKMADEKNVSIKFKENLHRGCLWWNSSLKETDYFDVAAATQDLYQDNFHSIIKWCKSHLPSKNLVLMGGCALNCSANSYAKSYYDNVWIMPSPGDAGSAIGAVLGKWNEHIRWPGPYLGYNIRKPYPIKNLLMELKENKIVGVANGRAEFGPRALGNRSLFADPRGETTKDRVNAIKQRQEFRPFAPVIREQDVEQIFYGAVGPYMQFVSKVRHPEKYPAISHVDGTARVQTVNYKQHPQLYTLLTKWYRETGCPILLNTSLNIKGKPIVNTESDAKEFAQTYGVNVY